MRKEVRVHFWGVRGSIASPLTSVNVQGKMLHLLREFVKLGTEGTEHDIAVFMAEQFKIAPFTYGGNTSCVEIEWDGQIYILDMGTGLRQLGNHLFPRMMSNRGIEMTLFSSHVHWDHIQGLPFLGELFINKHSGILNRFHFFGGTAWQGSAESVIKGQMNAPTFPVDWKEIELIVEQVDFQTIYDRFPAILKPGGPRVIFRKLNHPQETYGMRFEFPDGQVVVYATDNEPYDPAKPDPRLLALARGADVLICDCQYTKDDYEGKGGVARHGWGHSYPEAVVETALQADVKHLVLFHHDPASTDEKILGIQNLAIALAGKSELKITAAWEGLDLRLE